MKAGERNTGSRKAELIVNSSPLSEGWRLNYGLMVGVDERLTA